MSRLREVYSLIRETFSEYSDDGCSRLGAALAYYILLSLAPLLLLVIGIVGVLTGTDAARAQVVSQFQELVGPEGAKEVATILDRSNTHTTGGIISTIIGLGMLIAGATGVFVQLQEALNVVWNVPVKKQTGLGVWRMLQSRFLSFSMVVGLGFLLLVSLILGAALSGLSHWLDARVPGASRLFGVLNEVLSFLLATILFALIFKVLPTANVTWRSTAIGALVTAALFTLGKFLIGLYLGQTAVGSSFGAAGSLVVLLVWVYYSSQLLLLGAEFTQVYANRYGGGVASRATSSNTTTPVAA